VRVAPEAQRNDEGRVFLALFSLLKISEWRNEDVHGASAVNQMPAPLGTFPAPRFDEEPG